MIANGIKGIMVEIGGDTTKLQSVLKGVNTEMRNTQSQLQDVEKLLKLDLSNTELLTQRHRLLGHLAGYVDDVFPGIEGLWPYAYLRFKRDFNGFESVGTGNHMRITIDAPRELNIVRSKALEKRIQDPELREKMPRHYREEEHPEKYKK